MNYLAKKFRELPDDQKEAAMSEIIEAYAEAPKTIIDKIQFVLMADFTDTAIERQKNFGKMQGISSGYKSIDDMTKGFVGGELTIIAGKTSYGKTTLAMNIANHVALAGHSVLFVTMEMTHIELTSRYMHINGGYTDNYNTVAALTAFQKNDELDWKHIDGLIERAVKELNVELVVIDHLHYFTRELQNVAEDLGRITKEIKKNAIRHNIPVILISHVRKSQDGKQTTMEDLRGSSYIAQDADIVLMVGRDFDNDKLIVTIEKNRNRGFDYKRNSIDLDFDSTKITENPTWSV